jgi:hypothetical protein
MPDSPRPLFTWVTLIQTDDGGERSTVNRLWDDSPERCQLCPTCSKMEAFSVVGSGKVYACTVAFHGIVEPALSPTLSAW